MNDANAHKDVIQGIRNASQEQLQEILQVAITSGAKLPGVSARAAQARIQPAGQTPPGAEQPAIANDKDAPK